MKRVIPAAAAAAVIVGGIVVAGPLNPPGGPVASSYKTLSEVEPRIPISVATTPGNVDSIYRITSPGSYYLTGNLQGVSGKCGIEIASSNVTLDLNGFDLVGGVGTLDGITGTQANATGIAIENGTVRSWGGDGIDLASFATYHTRFARLRMLANGGSGLRAGSGAAVRECTSSINGLIGFDLVSACTLSDCVAMYNGGNGVDLGHHCVVTGCTASLNTGGGFEADGTTVFTACTAGANLGYGFMAGSGSSVTNCVARSSGSDGIIVTDGCTVSGNACNANGQQGTGAGVRATAMRNRIEANHCGSSDYGVRIEGAENIIIRNTCSGNTVANWSFAAGNAYGPIVAASLSLSAFNGSGPASGTLGSTDPNANFTY